MKAKVRKLQVGKSVFVESLATACLVYDKVEHRQGGMTFTIDLPNGDVRVLILRDEDDGIVAYGDF